MMNKYVYYKVSVWILVCALFTVAILKNKPEKDFQSSDFQKHVFNSNVLFIVNENEEDPGYFSGTIIKNMGTYYILTCGHGLEDLPNLEKLSVRSLIFGEDGELQSSLDIPVKLIAASYSEDSHKKGVDIAVFEVLDNTNVFGYANIKQVNLKPMDKVVCVGNSYGLFAGAVYEGSVVKQRISLNDKWPEKFFLTTCEIRSGCSGGGVFTKVNGKYYYCGMILRSDLKGEGMFRSIDSMNRWLVDHDLNFMVGK